MKAKKLIVLTVLAILLASTFACGEPGLSEAQQHYSAGYKLQSEGQFNEAIKEYSTALELDPEMVHAYKKRGEAYYAVGEFERAIEDFDEAIRLDPRYGEAYAVRAAAYTLLNMDAEAQQDIDRAIELGVDPALLEQLIEELK